MKSQRKGETESKRGRNREKRVGGRKRDGGGRKRDMVWDNNERWRETER